jgi:hypothetical protein
MQTPKGVTCNENQKIWRYMHTARFEAILKEKRIYFASANQFNDPFEGAVAVLPYNFPVDHRYNKIDHFEKAFAELKRLTKISCWHIEEHESTAMWKLYSDRGKGIAITSTPKKLSSSLTPFRLKQEYGIETLWGGNVKYVDLLQEKLKVSMLERFFFKHNAYSWEQEFRLAISVRMAEEYGVQVPEKGIFVEADILGMIEKIHIGPEIDGYKMKNVITLCEEYGLESKVHVTSLLGTPRYT